MMNEVTQPDDDTGRFETEQKHFTGRLVTEGDRSLADGLFEKHGVTNKDAAFQELLNADLRTEVPSGFGICAVFRGQEETPENFVGFMGLRLWEIPTEPETGDDYYIGITALLDPDLPASQRNPKEFLRDYLVAFRDNEQRADAGINTIYVSTDPGRETGQEKIQQYEAISRQYEGKGVCDFAYRMTTKDNDPQTPEPDWRRPDEPWEADPNVQWCVYKVPVNSVGIFVDALMNLERSANQSHAR